MDAPVLLSAPLVALFHAARADAPASVPALLDAGGVRLLLDAARAPPLLPTVIVLLSAALTSPAHAARVGTGEALGVVTAALGQCTARAEARGTAAAEEDDVLECAHAAVGFLMVAAGNGALAGGLVEAGAPALLCRALHAFVRPRRPTDAAPRGNFQALQVCVCGAV